MLPCNFCIMYEPEKKVAVEGCIQAGMDLTAMKNQGEQSWFGSSVAEKTGAGLMEITIQKVLTEHQAKLKVVWTNPHISSICAQMPNMTISKANAAAAMDATPLASEEWGLIEPYTLQTADQYRTGFSHVRELRPDVHQSMPQIEFREAERRCSQRSFIARFIKQALEDFT